MQATPDSPKPERRLRRPRRIAIAIAGGLLLTLILLEAGLWIAYGVHSPKQRVEPMGDGPRTILTIGDSNTYGVHLDPEDSYPGQLQGFLELSQENSWRIVNVGYPGKNSAQVRGALANAIEEHEAEIVIAWVGTNNTWSMAGRHLWKNPEHEEQAGALESTLQNLRSLKLARMVLNKLSGHTGGPRAVTPKHIARTLDMDLRRIQTICEEHGAKLLIADYPVHIAYTEEQVNQNLQRLARELGIPIVGLHDALLEVFYGLGYTRTMFGDYHANALGNYEVARSMLSALMELEFIETRAEWTDVPPLWTTLDEWPVRIIESDAEQATVLLHAPPSTRYLLRLARLYTIANDKTKNAAVKSEWYKARSPEELERLGFSGKLPQSGDLRIELALPPTPTRHPQTKKGEVLWLGWQLKLELSNEEGPLRLPDKQARVVVLLDPAVGPPQ